MSINGIVKKTKLHIIVKFDGTIQSNRREDI